MLMESTKEKFIPREAKINPDISADEREEEEKNEDASGEENFPKEFPFGVPTELINEKGGWHRRSKNKKSEEKQKEES